MSTRDYNQGMADAGWMASLRTKAQVQATAQQWRSYCEALERQLNKARLTEMQRTAELAGRDAQQKALRAALRELAPDHQLLGELPRIGNEAMAKHFLSNGYVFDPEKRLLSKA
ncbi:hypothetical protein [Burkholderia vietnamiensis]|uniref:hypothetical protein n=1 Tax=Burkholderia vietnamiensis TaxID=60552 RepID=UPI001CF28110|nr:hypothetical protein [Burkholderia vietnamiensis]MCA8290020.1 hypothetical protein [Burkholderia vietnamiensis]